MDGISHPFSPRSRSIMSYFDPQEPHYLDSCSLCSKPLGYNSDIFMYRGNTPFCSKECRQEQIEMDEAKDKSWKRSSSRSIRQSTDSKTTTSSSSSSSSSPSKSVRTGTVAVA